MKRALISVSNKDGILEFAKNLVELEYEIISTGGTYNALLNASIPVTSVSDITKFPECLDGRVKTLHPAIHAGVLAIRSNKEHMQQLENLNIDTIDIVVVNLYPFKETILKENVELEEAIENIDIGGPTMLRAAAKNYKDVTVIIDPLDYEKVVTEIRENKEVSLETKFYLSAKVFNHTSHYDTLIANYLAKKANLDYLPDTISMTYEKVQNMRYGENPHQRASFYKEIGSYKGLLTNAKQLHGKELSFNNVNDTNGALDLLKEFDKPTIVACKHANPCGVGSAENIFEAYKKAYSADPISIFGGIIVSNKEIDENTAKEIDKIFIEIVLAPSFSKEALEVLTKKKNIRLLVLDNLELKQEKGSLDIKKVSGGILVQDINNELVNNIDFKVVTKKQPTEQEIEDMLFALKIVKYTKSNGISVAKNLQSVGIGAGQVNRIWACKQAIEHGIESLGKDVLNGAVLASDAFFPFPDCVEECAKAKIKAIIQPGGSIKDELSIEACNKYGISMIFTNLRHFKH